MARITEKGLANKAKRDYLESVRRNERRPMIPLSELFLRKYRLGPFRVVSRTSSAREIVRSAMDAAPAKPMTFARHDEIYHDGMFDPATMTCALRQEFADGEMLDSDEPPVSNSKHDMGGGKKKMSCFASSREAAEYREAYDAIVAARKSGDARKSATIMEYARQIFDTVRHRAFADSEILDGDGEPKTVYHGTDRGGFTVFDCAGSGKTSETGAWFSDSRGNAFSYGGSHDRFVPTVIDEDHLNKYEMLSKVWTILNADGEPKIDSTGYRSETELLGDYELEEGERTAEVYNLTDMNGYDCGNFNSVNEAVRYAASNRQDFIDSSEAERCIYECNLMLRQPEQYDVEGQHWDEISIDWVVRGGSDEEAEPMYFGSREEAEDFLEEHEDEGYTEVEPGCTHTSDQLARDARQNGWSDGCVLQDISDYGRYGYSADEVTEYIAFSPSSIKLADLFTFEDDGTLVGLNNRFNFADPDIRH